MTDVFLCGPLADAALRDILFGRAIDATPAELPDHILYALEPPPFTVPVAQQGADVQGVLLRDLGTADLDRLAFLAALPDQDPQITPVRTAGSTVMAQVWIARIPAEGGAPWNGDEWAARWQKITLAALGDAMARYGTQSATLIRSRWPMMMVRAASRVRAGETAPLATTRHDAAPADVTLDQLRQPYANFFAVEEYDLSFRRFDASPSPVITRAVFISGDAVTVLPYDPVRDRVLLVEQFRAGPYARGDAQPWLIEAIAGRVDPGETPEQAARREAVEEAGLTLGALLWVGGYYPSPGAKSEYLYSYVALTDLPDDAAGVFGLAEEAEDIRGHLLGFDKMMALVASGEIANAPLILTAYWLQAARARLRASHSG